MPKYNYVIWKHVRIKNNVVLDKFMGFNADWKITTGVSVIADWPDDARLRMNPERSDDTILTDDLRNLESMIVASGRLAEVLRKEGFDELELLPVTIINHKKKPIKEPYFIIHPLNPIACIDKARSKLEMSPISPGHIAQAYKLALDEKKINKGRQIFRVAGLAGPVFVSRELAAKLDKERFSGLGCEEIDTFTTMPI